ncbi:MAG: hypothetical protein ACI814_004490, partial [Mariniblastus sp.]
MSETTDRTSPVNAPAEGSLFERPSTAKPTSLLEKVIYFCLMQKLVV